jgi:DNA-binding ferritin-like protein (Dps family)
MFEKFTDRARKVVALAQQEAIQQNHDYIAAEHILLGIIKEGGGVAVNILRNLGVNLEDLRKDILKLIPPGNKPAPVGKLPFTPNTTNILTGAISSAKELSDNYIGTEHILMGIFKISDSSIPHYLLRERGLTLESVKAERNRMFKDSIAKDLSSSVHSLMMKGHEGQKRSNGAPYHTHPQAVKDLLVKVGITDSDVLNTALCHDLLEDTKITEEEIKKVAGDAVLFSVKQLTNLPDKSIPAEQIKWDFATKHQNMLRHAVEYNDISKRVKLADRYCNLCDAIWDWEPYRVKRYAKAGLELLEVMQPLPDDVAELEREARRFFGCLV